MKIAQIDQVTTFHGTFNEGYFCVNLVQPLYFAFKSFVTGKCFKKNANGMGLQH